MSKRRLRVLAEVAVIVLIAIVFWPRTDRITEKDFGRIQKGMTLAEVSAILGPAGDYTTEPLVWLRFVHPPAVHPKDKRVDWLTDQGQWVVVFDTSDRVKTKWFAVAWKGKDEATIERFLRRIARPWRQWFS